MEAEFEGVPHLFWAVELVPGKEYTTTVPAELRITQAVLPASAKDNGRSVVSIQFSSEEDGEKEKAIAIASLRLDNQDSQALEVMVDDDSTITLSVSGKNPVHLSGYYVPDDNEGEDDFYGDDEIDSDELGSDEEEEEDEEAEEAAQKAMAAQLAKKRQQQQQNGGENKKAKVEAAAAPKQQQQPKKQQEAQPKKQQQPQQKTPQAKVYPNGLQTTTTREGQGAEATKGRRVSVKYVGKLTKNNKVFDASTKPFTFTLGAHEVITGWDLGVAGMKVGEKRTLVIPSELGYGKKGAGKDIPPNSSLTFDVELLHVK